MPDRFTARRRAASDRAIRIAEHFWTVGADDLADRAHDLYCRTLGNYDRPVGPAHRLP